MTRPWSRWRRTAPLAIVACSALVVAACGTDGGDRDDEPDASPSPRPTPTVTSTPSTPDPGAGDRAVARSETRTDSVYPDIGNAIVDALHYDLTLDWNPEQDLLTATQVLTFRAAEDSPTIPLEFNEQLAISALTVDGNDTPFDVTGTDLVIEQAIKKDQEYEVELAYAGTPEPTTAPSQRSDFAAGLGWSISSDHETSTLQEPYGAFTWYAVNDQPADKALYDFTLSVPDPWSGVANGKLTNSSVEDGTKTNTWHLAEPASSYLVTVAFGDYQHTSMTSASGVPIQIWAPADGPALPGDLDYTADAMDWVEGILGPYPFDTFGILVVDNESGMETQTMVTLGNTRYSLSAAVLVHEIAHHWYGNTVTPADWSDVWMNEGMAMYVQGMWEAEQQGVDVSAVMDQWADFESQLRASAGPPAAFHADKFGDGNIYYGPALMWHELRGMVGDDTFFEVLREWPAAQENQNSDRQEYWDWLEETTGKELTAFFDAWLLGDVQPPRG